MTPRFSLMVWRRSIARWPASRPRLLPPRPPRPPRRLLARHRRRSRSLRQARPRHRAAWQSSGRADRNLSTYRSGARVYTASQTDNILAGLALRGFAAGTSYAPGGMAILGERGPELVQIPGNRQSGGSSGGGSETQVAAQFMTELAKAINTKASTTQQAANALADMLVNAASVNVQTSMLRQLSRR